MPFFRIAFSMLLAGAVPLASSVRADEQTTEALHLELNTVKDTGTACRLTFIANNRTGSDIEQAVFETVFFDPSGSVLSLSLFDFRELPAGKPRVRQFDVPGIECVTLGQALINGANTCTVDGSESALCDDKLLIDSRTEVELLG